MIISDEETRVGGQGYSSLQLCTVPIYDTTIQVSDKASNKRLLLHSRISVFFTDTRNLCSGWKIATTVFLAAGKSFINASIAVHRLHIQTSLPNLSIHKCDHGGR